MAPKPSPTLRALFAALLVWPAAAAAAGPKAAPPAPEAPLAPLASAITDMPYLRAAIVSQIDGLPWRNEDMARYLKLDVENPAPPRTIDGQARRVVAGLVARGEELWHDRETLDAAVGRSPAQGVLSRAGLLSRDPDFSERLERLRARVDVADPSAVAELRDRFAALFDKAVASQKDRVRDLRPRFAERAAAPSTVSPEPASLLPFMTPAQREEARDRALEQALERQEALAQLRADEERAALVKDSPRRAAAEPRRRVVLKRATRFKKLGRRPARVAAGGSAQILDFPGARFDRFPSVPD